jgi:probable HAF family extracellular repeat protein
MFRPALVQDRAALSADGTTVAGSTVTQGLGIQAFRWIPPADFEGLGDLPGGNFGSGGFGVSADGSVVVGYGTTANGDGAFRWTQATGMTFLGDLPGGETESIARGVSPDGTVVVGQSTSTGDQQQAFRWTSQTGMVGLGFLPGADGSAARAVSADGSVVVGVNSFPSIPLQNIHTEAFRWTAAAGMMSLGDLPGGRIISEAYDVSADGSVIVGISETLPENGNRIQAPFYWTEKTGMLNLRDVLVSVGVNLDGWRLTGAHAVSHDGLTIVGVGEHNGVGQGWVATIPEPSTIVLAAATLLSFLGFRLRRSSGRAYSECKTIVSDDVSVPSRRSFFAQGVRHHGRRCGSEFLTV